MAKQEVQQSKTTPTVSLCFLTGLAVAGWIYSHSYDKIEYNNEIYMLRRILCMYIRKETTTDYEAVYSVVKMCL